MTPEAIRALELRQQLSKTSVKKLDALRARVAPDDVLRNNYKFYGAHTGRWSGEGVQLQNLPRGTVKLYDEAVHAITYDQGVTPFGKQVFGAPALEVISSCLRGAFQAPDGYKFVVADLSAIEVRVLAWLTRCQPMLDVFVRGEDPYVDFASFMYGTPHLHVTKSQRQIAKSAVLGCGYQLSAGEERVDKNGDEYKSGLWGYAENMGIHMSQDQAGAAVLAYRGRYREVVNFWYDVEDAAVHCVHSNERTAVHGLLFWTVPGKVLCVDLPSGRRLHYLNPRLEPGKYKRPSLTHQTHGLTGWVREQLYGGLLTENLVQAIARDVLAEGMLRADGLGMQIVGHTHDEIICLSLDELPAHPALDILIHCMTKPMPWAPDLPLAAEGWDGKIYRK